MSYHTISHPNTALTNEELFRHVPSIFAEVPHHARSEAYSYLSTREILTALRDENYFPYSATESRTRLADKQGFTKHMIRFRQGSQASSTQLEAVREVILVNSFDGTSSFKLISGVFRFVCLNGLVVGDTVQEVAIPHKRVALDDVLEGVYSVVEDFEKVTESIERMRACELTRPDRLQLGNAALQLRYDLETEAYPSLTSMLRVRRSSDEKTDLWTTFNAVQENLLKGGMRTAENLQGKPPRLVRAVQSISDSIRLNKALWNLAESYC